VDFTSLAEGVNYISVEVFDGALNRTVATDVFYVKKYVEDTEAPGVIDNQTGDDTLYSSDPGPVFNVDFYDTGGSLLSYAQYAAWTETGMNGTETVAWSFIAENIDTSVYTENWGVDFAALATGTNYISVFAADNAGNVSAVATDVFYVMKGGEEPQTYAGPVISKGWNQVGISKQGFSMDMDSVFDSIVYEVVDPALNFLTASGTMSFTTSKGYWIYSDAPKGIVTEYTGTDYTSNLATIPLVQGWNMFSIPFAEPMYWNDAHALLTIGSLPDVYHYENATKEYSKIEPNTMGGMLLLPWRAYWFYAETGRILMLTK